MRETKLDLIVARSFRFRRVCDRRTRKARKCVWIVRAARLRREGKGGGGVVCEGGGGGGGVCEGGEERWWREDSSAETRLRRD